MTRIIRSSILSAVLTAAISLVFVEMQVLPAAAQSCGDQGLAPPQNLDAGGAAATGIGPSNADEACLPPSPTPTPTPRLRPHRRLRPHLLRRRRRPRPRPARIPARDRSAIWPNSASTR